MKHVYFRGRTQGGIFHSLYRTLIEYPPQEYEIHAGASGPQDQQPFSSLTRRQQRIQSVDKKLRDSAALRDCWREARTLLHTGIKRLQGLYHVQIEGADLVYCSQQLMFNKLPWVVDLEYADALVDYGDIRLVRNIVRKQLASRHCKKIMPWSDWAKRTLHRSIDCGNLKEKIQTVHFGITPKKPVKTRRDGKLRFLFVGSINLFNFMNFEWKGGYEVIEAFLELSRKYDNLELVVRSWVPPDIMERCSRVQNIKILHSPMSNEALAKLYESSDICLLPGHMNLGMVVLEAMSYQLPVVAHAIYDIPEAIQDMKSGILLSPSPKIHYYTWNGAPNHQSRTMMPEIRACRTLMVKQLVEKASLLIEDGSLRRRLGQQAKHQMEQGDFSITARNQKLKRIFDEALEHS